jgi:hypothetical protein
MNLRKACLIAIPLFLAICALGYARTWKLSGGRTVEAEFESQTGPYVVLKKEDGSTMKVAFASLSIEDRAYVAEAKRTGNKPSAAVADEKAFMEVINARCVRCHRPACANVDTLVEKKWIVPGKPNSSPVCTVIGKNRRPGGTYHNLSDAEARTIKDFVTAYHPGEKLASAPKP